MIENQFKDLIKGLKSGEYRASLDHAEMHLKDRDPIPLTMSVEMEARAGRLKCLIRTTGTTTLPPSLTTLSSLKGDPIFVTEKDFFRITAMTSERISVALEGISPVSSDQQSFLNASGGSHIHAFDFQKVGFPPIGFDSLDTDGLLDLLHGNKKQALMVGSEQEREPRKSIPEDEHFAVIPGVKLLIRPDATISTHNHPFLGESTSTSYNCFKAEIAGGHFCLEDKEGDLLVYFRRPRNTGGPSSAQIFEGILTAIGYTHCIHPWPYFRQHKEDHRIIERWIKPPQKCTLDGLLPMSEGRLRQSPHLFIKAAEFFSAKNAQSESFERALWLLHEGNPDGMAFELRVLTLCSILEGLLKKHSGGNLGTSDIPWKKAILSLGLEWDSWFKDVFQSWSDYRNKLAHGFDVLPSANNPIDIFSVYSRIFGAIYIIMAQQMGFSGDMESSLLEHMKVVTINK